MWYKEETIFVSCPLPPPKKGDTLLHAGKLTSKLKITWLKRKIAWTKPSFWKVSAVDLKHLKTNVMWSAKFYNFILEAENQTPSLKVSNDPLDAKKRKWQGDRNFCKGSLPSGICFFLFCVCLTSGVYHAPSFQGRRVGKTYTTFRFICYPSF